MKSNGSIPFYYWFFGGLVLGVLIGWFFSGFINLLFRILLLVGVVVVIGLVVYLWRKTTSSSGSTSNQSDIPEGNWRNIDPSGRK